MSHWFQKNVHDIIGCFVTGDYNLDDAGEQAAGFLHWLHALDNATVTLAGVRLMALVSRNGSVTQMIRPADIRMCQIAGGLVQLLGVGQTKCPELHIFCMAANDLGVLDPLFQLVRYLVKLAKDVIAMANRDQAPNPQPNNPCFYDSAHWCCIPLHRRWSTASAQYAVR